MLLSSGRDALSRARELLDVSGTSVGTAHRVRRLDVPETAYFIVRLEQHVACLDAATGELLMAGESAIPPALLSADEAKRLAGMDAQAVAELVWQPCAASQSMLDPIWALTDAATTRYVDQRGGVTMNLEPKQPGGG